MCCTSERGFNITFRDLALGTDEALCCDCCLNRADIRQFFPLDDDCSESLRERIFRLRAKDRNNFTDILRLADDEQRLIVNDAAPTVVREILCSHGTHNTRNQQCGRGIKTHKSRVREGAVHQAAVQFSMHHRTIIDVFRRACHMR